MFCVSVCLSVCLSAGLSVALSVGLPVGLSVGLCSWLFVCLYLLNFQNVLSILFLSVFFYSVSWSVCRKNYPIFACLSPCLFIDLLVHFLFVCHSVFQSLFFLLLRVQIILSTLNISSI
jgi:hypothetical protein